MATLTNELSLGSVAYWLFLLYTMQQEMLIFVGADEPDKRETTSVCIEFMDTLTPQY